MENAPKWYLEFQVEILQERLKMIQGIIQYDEWDAPWFNVNWMIQVIEGKHDDSEILNSPKYKALLKAQRNAEKKNVL